MTTGSTTIVWAVNPGPAGTAVMSVLMDAPLAGDDDNGTAGAGCSCTTSW